MRRLEAIRRLPWSIVALAAALVLVGWLGIWRSQQLSGTSARLVERQMLWSLVCLAAMLMATLPSYRMLAHYSYAAFAASLVLLIAVYWFPPVNGAHRWIRFGGIGMQPSEFAKVAVVLALAQYLKYRESYRRFWGLLVPLVAVMVPVLLILKEPDLGTALVFLPVVFVMLFAAGARREHLAFLVLVALASTPMLWSQMSREQKSRITALAEQTSAGARPSEDGYHLHRAKRVLALGGWTGSFWSGEVNCEIGPPRSDREVASAGNVSTDEPPIDRIAYRVPEPHTDSIAAVLGERFGLAGWVTLLALFMLLVWRVLVVAQFTREPFGRLVATGIAALIGTQMTINMGMLVGLLPITGLALPFVSYGGSSLLANCLALGLVLNIGLRPGYEVTPEPFAFVD